MKRIILLAIVIAISSSLFSQVQTSGGISVPQQIIIDPGQSITVVANPCDKGNPVVHIIPTAKNTGHKKSAGVGTTNDSYNNNVYVINMADPQKSGAMNVSNSDDRYYYYNRWNTNWIRAVLLIALIAAILIWALARSRNSEKAADHYHIYEKTESKPSYDLKDVMGHAKSAGAALEVNADGGFRIKYPKPTDEQSSQK